MKTPICPILLFYKGDENRCDISKCNYSKKTKYCTMSCLKYKFSVDNTKKQCYNSFI